MRVLARLVDRDVSIVGRDLDRRDEAELVEFERDGRAKRSGLAHETVVAEPLVLDDRIARVGHGGSRSELPAA